MLCPKFMQTLRILIFRGAIPRVKIIARAPFPLHFQLLTVILILKMAISIFPTTPTNLHFAVGQTSTPRPVLPVKPGYSLQIRKRDILSASLFFGLEGRRRPTLSLGLVKVSASSSVSRDRRRKLYPGEAKGFVEEMRFVAMRLHRTSKDKDTSTSQEEGKDKEAEGDGNVQVVHAWEPTIEGYLQFLVDSKLVFHRLEAIVHTAVHPSYANFRNTGLERVQNLAKDLEWFAQQGYNIPGPSSPGTSYSRYLEELAESDPPAFICHFYNIYFAHTAGGQMIGRQVAKKILDGRELEFYKWDRDLPQMLKIVKEKLNKVAEGWSRQQKNRCLAETAKSFKYSGNIIRLIIL